jgi:hypothetical protein
MTTEQMQECMKNNFDNIQKVRTKIFKNLFEIYLFFSIISEQQVIKNKRIIEIQ